jgi:hypothetical protein
MGVPRYSFRRPYAPSTPPEGSLHSLLYAVLLGRPFSRKLTSTERLALALADAKPRRHLTLTSDSLDRDEICEAWLSLRKRLARERRMPNKLVYVAVAVRSTDNDGHHLHCLLWGDYLHLPTIAGHARAVGFGMQLKIPVVGPTPQDALRVTQYVLGQCEPVFGSRHHLRNLPQPKGKRSYLRPHATTLASVAPEVLSAFDRATNQHPSDRALALSCPLFNKNYDHPYVSSYRLEKQEVGING